MGVLIRSRHIVCLILVVSAGCWPVTVPVELEMAEQASSDPSNLMPQTKDLSKKINLVLTGLVVSLTVATYWILLRYTPDLSHEIALPSRFLEDNIAAVLAKAWPEQYMGPSTERLPEHLSGLPWVIFYRAFTRSCTTKETKTGFSKSERADYRIHGYSEVPLRPATGESQPIQPRERKPIMIRTFSPVMRSLVQAAVWNYVSFWLVLVMVTNTVIYNGFASNNLSNDSVLRLVLVGLYALTTLLARTHFSAQLYHNFTCAVFQTCWAFLCSDFIFVNGSDYRSQRVDKESCCYLDGLGKRAPEEVWAILGLELFGKTERLHTYHPIYRINFYEGIKGWNVTERQKFWELHDKRCQSHVREWYNGKTGASAFDKFTKPVREAEIKAYEKAAETVLEKTLANTAAILGICLATALAPWTSTDNTDATASQLGSYALLLTISTGLFAITGIVGQLQNATKSARTLLKLQERTIHAAATDTNTANSPLDDKPPLSFTEGIKDQLVVTPTRLWSQASLWGKLGSTFLGPALTLIPRLHRDCTDRANIYFKVGKEDFALKTDFEESPGCSPRLFRPAPQPTSKKAEVV